MISVTDAWKENQLDLIVTEGFVEIKFEGTNLVFDKTHITKYTHSQDGCLLSGKLPTNQISFSLDNTLGAYNPNTANFAELQKITVRYGFDYNGDGVADEWIKAGTFYLTEWHTPANGLETSFEARDLLVSYAKFEQTLVLPDDVDKAHIKAKVKHGVLHIKLPRKAAEEQE